MQKQEQPVVLCAASAYEKKYYLNPLFDRLTETIKDELKILCVLFTEDVGGVLALEFDEDGKLFFHTEYDEGDFSYDEIGSELKIKQMQREQYELLESLELYYRILIKKEEDYVTGN